MSPAEAEELERQGRIKYMIAEDLARPKPRRVTLRDHGPWNILERRCHGCNRTELELYSTPVMPPCRS